MLRYHASDPWFCRLTGLSRINGAPASPFLRACCAHVFRHLGGRAPGIDDLRSIQPRFDPPFAQHNARAIERSDVRPNSRVRDGGVHRCRHPLRVRSGVGVVIVGQLVFQPARPRLPARQVDPLIHSLDQVLHARIAVGQEHPVEPSIAIANRRGAACIPAG